MPEDIESSFAVKTTETLMNLTTLMGTLKGLRAVVAESELISDEVASLLDAYESTNDQLVGMLVTANEHIISQDDMLNDIFTKLDGLKK